MTRIDREVAYAAANWGRDFAYGTRGIRGQDNIINALASWGSDDNAYVNGTRADPTARTLARLAFATAVRQAMREARRSMTLMFWFGESIPENWNGVHTTTVVIPQIGNIQPTTLHIGRYRDFADYHWFAGMSTPNGWNTESDSANYLESLTGNATNNLVFEAAQDGSGYAGTVRPSDELLESLPVRSRPYASRTVSVRPGAGQRVHWQLHDDVVSLITHDVTNVNLSALNLTGEQLVESARLAYRSWLRMRSTRAVDQREAQAEEARRQHQVKSARNFATFRNKPVIEERLIPTLPFLPHGLASSRRWGIEIETGGARGIQAPNNWRRKTDSSVRSAWDGYLEVQDFEPYDEEVTTNLSWFECQNYANHVPQEDYFDEERQEYALRPNPNYMPISACEHCGNRTTTVRREPQTIRHTRQSDDCAEFVSPILVSMHSNGLETLLAQVSQQPQNDSAGVHVHVEALDLNDTQIATLIYGYDLLEHLIESSYQRGATRNYCKRRPEDNVLDAARSLKAGKSKSFVGGDRYVTTNTNSLSRHGTIEFRAMGAVYDYNYLIRWAMFCREMINVVAAGATHKDFGRIKKWEDVLILFARFGKEYIRAAVFEMTGETGSQKRLASEKRAITTEAANQDLADTIARIASATEDADEAFRRLSRTIAPVVRNVQDLTAITSRLAVSDSLIETV